MKTQIFEYAIFWTPTKEEAEKGQKAKMLVEPTSTLSSDPQSVNILAARKIPENYINNLEQITIAVRPF